MRFRLISLLWIFAFCIYFCSSKAADPVSDVILPLGRVVNAILLQQLLREDSNNAIPIVADFLNVNKTDFEAIYQMGNLNEQRAQLLKGSNLIKNITTINAKTLDKTINGLEALTRIKKDEGNLTSDSFKSPTMLLEKSSTIGKIIRKSRDIDKTKFESVETVLREMKESEAKNVNETSLKRMLLNLKDSVTYATQAVKSISKYEEVYKDFYDFSELSSQVGPYLSLSKSIATISQNFDDISQFDQAAPILSDQSNNLQSSKANFETLSMLFSNVSEVLQIGTRLSTISSNKKLTLGLPNSVQDLRKVMNDINIPLIVNSILKGNNTRRIRNSLKRISALSLDQSMAKKVAYDPMILEDFRSYGTVLSSVMSAARQAAQNKGVEEQLNSLAPCVKMLKKDDKVLNFEELNSVTSHIAHISSKLTAFDKVMKEISENKGFEDFKKDLELLSEILDDIMREVDHNKQSEVWDNVRAMDLLEKHRGIFSSIQKLDDDPFNLGGKNLPINILNEMLDSATRSNLFEALKCLPASSPDISELIDSGRKVAELKNQINKLEAVLPILDRILNFRKSAVSAILETKKAEGSDNFRLGSGTVSSVAFNKSELFLVATGLLIDAEKIRKSDSSISRVINPSDPVKRFVEKVQGVDVYNDEFRKSLSELLASVQGFFKTVSSKPAKTLKDVLKIVDNLSKLKGHSLKDVHKLSDPIAKELSRSSDPQVKEAAKDFETVGALHLDFASFESLSKFEKSIGKLFEPFKRPEYTEPTTTPKGWLDELDEFANSPWGSAFFYLLIGLMYAVFIFVVVWIIRDCIKTRKENDESDDDIEKGNNTKNGEKTKKKGDPNKKNENKRSQTASTGSAQSSVASTPQQSSTGSKELTPATKPSAEKTKSVEGSGEAVKKEKKKMRKARWQK